MDTPGLPEAAPEHNEHEGPEERVIDINDIRYKDYSDDHFAAHQLADWAHPARTPDKIVEVILYAAYGESKKPSKRHLQKLLQQDRYISTPFDSGDSFHVAIVTAIQQSTEMAQIEAIEIIRRLHIMTTSGEDPIGASPDILIILERIVGDRLV